jgi:para-nitrobenzyl esterase
MGTGNWTRRELLGCGALAAAATLAHAQGAGATQVTTQQGTLRGQTNGGVRIFKGIPFAEPPIGPLRFRPPVAARSWTGTRDAMQFAASAMQSGHAPTSEDCLYLNVFAPEGKGPFPVFYWIHGGGFTGGSPNDFDGSVFARQGVICVTVAYRLGVFGFLDWSPILGPAYADSANNGLRDLIMGLQWVKTNIHAFGGDPSNVVIGGESAGAKLVAFLLGIDDAAQLFHAAISESGGGERINDPDQSRRVTQAFAATLPGQSAASILSAPATALITAQQALIAAWPGNFPLRAQSGGALLPHRALPAIAAGRSRNKRLLIGTNRDENAFYLGDKAAEPITQKRLANSTEAQFNAVLARYRTIYPTMSPAGLNIRALTAEEYWVPSIRVADALARGGGHIWFYRLDETAATGAHKGMAYHGYDLGYVWETLANGEPPAAQKLSEQIHDAWVAFIKGNAPVATGLPNWPLWNPQSRPTMILNTTSKVEQQPFEAELRLWDAFRFE